MIVLDTNVLSEHLKKQPDPRVTTWLAAHLHEAALTTITVAEMRFGALTLDDGARQRALMTWLDATFADASAAGRIYRLDGEAAEELALLRASTRRRGRTVAFEDLAIAAICKARRASVATRNVKHFEGLGIEVVDPWAA